ncbi:MAG TPA: hypothetical protein VE964_18305 [Myxococcales bacterium]|nr:hypothetical protein [Myxococcales bacterium]
MAPASPASFKTTLFLTWKGNRPYRVYVEGGQVYFIRSARPKLHPGASAAIAGQFGLLGGLAVGLAGASGGGKKSDRFVDEGDPTPPSRLLSLHAENFVLSPSEIEQARIEPAGRYASFGPNAGRWHFNRSGGGEMVFLFESPAEVNAAAAALAPLLGNALRVRAVLDSRSARESSADALVRFRDRVKGSARVKRWWPVAVAVLGFSLAFLRGYNLTAYRKGTPAQAAISKEAPPARTERMPDPAEFESLPCPQRLDAWMTRCVPACTPSCEWRHGAAVCDWRHPERDRGARACIDQCSREPRLQCSQD